MAWAASLARTLILLIASLLSAAALAAALSPRADASTVQPNFSESVVFDDLDTPTDLAFAGDGRVFIAEKSGFIRVFANLNATSPTVVADLRTQVYNSGDRGLLSIALDPQFPARPYIYALYTLDAVIGETPPRWGQPNSTDDPCPTPPGPTDDGCLVSTRLSKLTLSGSTATSEQVLINDWCQQYTSHSAGTVAFGPDGKLYASGGDGASYTFTDYGQRGQPRNPCGDPPVPTGGQQTPPGAEGGALRSQDIRTMTDPLGLDGTLIRVDPDTGAGVPGNPMSTSADPNARRVIANGMRNPFRFAFRPGTPEIYVGDVGWTAWEEINYITRADDATVDNFGWPCYENLGRQPGYDGAGLTLCNGLYGSPGAVVSPLYAYAHGSQVVSGDNCATGGSSTSGIAFYEGGNYPASYSGALFFADYSRQCAWVMFENGGQLVPSTRQLFLRNVFPVSLEIGPGGDLFVVDITGSIRRVSYAGVNRAPTAVATAQPESGPLPLKVDFDGSGSSDPDAGDTIKYAWDLDGDGAFDDSTAAKPSWTYTTVATVTVRLRVTDSGGLSGTDTIQIGAGNDPPQAEIISPSPALKWSVGDEVAFSGAATDGQDGQLGGASMSWHLIQHHCFTVDDCHVHPAVAAFDEVASGTFKAPDHEYPSHLELRLTVTDSGGLSDSTSIQLDPRTVDLTFRTNPAGLSLTAGADSATTPFTRTVIAGSRNTISAPTPQALSGTWQRFVSWSDGGAASHEIIAPATAATYTATYEPSPPPPGLVLALGFDEPSGATATDASPAKNNGTLNGATRTASGRFGGALSFDGVNDRVDVADAASLDLTNGMTLEAWLRPTSNSGWRTAILKERGNAHVYALYGSEGSAPISETFIGSSYNGAAAGGPLPLNTWTHLASTYDGAVLRLFVNGTQVGSKATTGSMAATTNPLRIGGNAVWGEYFSGLIDEVRIYNRALSATEVQADMNTGIGGGGALASLGLTPAPEAQTLTVARTAGGKAFVCGLPGHSEPLLSVRPPSDSPAV